MLPREDRAIFLLAGQTLNALGIFMKLARLSAGFTTSWEIGDRLTSAQAQLLLRTVIGVLYEGWQWQTGHLIGPHLKQHYLPRLSEAERQARKRLSKVFTGRSSALGRVRNDFAFHAPSIEVLDSAFRLSPDHEDWSIYSSPNYTTSFNFACELPIGYGIAALYGESDLNKTFRQVMIEAIASVNDMNEVTSGYLRACLTQNNLVSNIEILRVNGVPQERQMSLPFFVEPGELSREE